MARYIISLYCIVFLFWQLILINFTEARDEILKGMIKDGETELHFNWKKTNQLLANENLPVWLASSHSHSSCSNSHSSVIHELQKNFMKEHVGKFTLYHDIEKLSAVVYFENTKTLHGMIDIRYIINGMPIDECNEGHQVGGNYVKRSEEKLDIHDYLKPFKSPTYDRNENSGAVSGESSSAPDDAFEIPKKRQRVEDNDDEGQVTTLYPEFLVFIPYDTIKQVKNIGPKKTSVAVLRHFIVYFNAVNMLLAKLSTDDIKIHLNLAGIVFEGKSNVFDFMVPIDTNGPPDAPGPRRYIKYDSTFIQITNYINNNLDTFPEDSFDFFFVPFEMNFWAHGIQAQGISRSLDYYKIRKDPPMNRIRLGLIINQGSPCEYITAAHEIGHLLGIKHESRYKGFGTYVSQCYAIMQEIGEYCIDCIKWTEENVVDLKKFVKENQNRCFLLNEPRSLYPHGHRMKMLSRLEQCQCYGFQHWPIKDLEDYIDEVPQNGCNQLMICGENSQAVNTILPFDGTLCATNKVCWNGACQRISYVGPSTLQGPSN